MGPNFHLAKLFDVKFPISFFSSCSTAGKENQIYSKNENDKLN